MRTFAILKGPFIDSELVYLKVVFSQQLQQWWTYEMILYNINGFPVFSVKFCKCFFLLHQRFHYLNYFLKIISSSLPCTFPFLFPPGSAPETRKIEKKDQQPCSDFVNLLEYEYMCTVNKLQSKNWLFSCMFRIERKIVHDGTEKIIPLYK